MVEPKWTPALTKTAQETVRTMARLQSDLDLAKAENVRLRAEVERLKSANEHWHLRVKQLLGEQS